MVRQIDDAVVIGNDNGGSESELEADLNQVVAAIIREAQSGHSPPAGSQQHQAIAALTPDQAQEVKRALDALNQCDANNMDGELRANIGSFHFRLRTAIYDSLIIAGSISGGVIAAVAAPGVGAVALVAAVADAVQRIQEHVTKLDPSELLIYRALVAIQKRELAQGAGAVHATAEEIKAYLDSQQGQAPELEDIVDLLDTMRDKEVVEESKMKGKGAFAAVI